MKEILCRPKDNIYPATDTLWSTRRNCGDGILMRRHDQSEHVTLISLGCRGSCNDCQASFLHVKYRTQAIAAPLNRGQKNMELNTRKP